MDQYHPIKCELGTNDVSTEASGDYHALQLYCAIPSSDTTASYPAANWNSSRSSSAAAVQCADSSGKPAAAYRPSTYSLPGNLESYQSTTESYWPRPLGSQPDQWCVFSNSSYHSGVFQQPFPTYEAATMGNQQSVVIDGERYDIPKARRTMIQLRNEVLQLKHERDELNAHYIEARALLNQKEAEVTSLTEELDKVKSVLQQKIMKGKPDILATIQEGGMMDTQGQMKKKQGVSGESRTDIQQIRLKHYEKDFSSKHQIRQALKENDFLKNLDNSQVHEIINCMYEERVDQGDYIIKENDAGNHLYVLAEGTLEVIKNNRVVGHVQQGTAFGELAILYGCTRTASIKAVRNAKYWALERTVFQAIMMRTGIERQKERLEFLQSVESFKHLADDKLSKIADVLDVDYFEEGEFIIREGEVGDTFYIISSGVVRVTQKVLAQNEPKEIRELGRGMYFGEKALLTEDRRTASVLAKAPGVELLTLNRTAFTSLIGKLSQFRDRDYGDDERQAEWLKNKKSDISLTGIYDTQKSASANLSDIFLQCPPQPQKGPAIDPFFKDIQLTDMEVLATLGIGGFGRVELVQYLPDKTKTYALKCLKKQHIVETRQQEHIYSEKRIMLTCQSPYIVKLYRTFKDKKFVYMMMEACLGGELWTILRDRAYFDDNTARFAVACVLKAFQYLHSMGIIYRDLKPENLLVTVDGFVKLVDFGFAKTLQAGKKTWTFCGTPEYVAPEIILNKGHDHAVDIWAIGILIYELTTGTPPFTSTDPMKTYNIILKGVDAHEFPKRVSRNATNLIKRLCRPNPSDRLGYQKNGLSDIMKHKWFQGFDWEGLETRDITSPFKRKVANQYDTSNFDKYPTEITVPPNETSGWDDDF